MSQTGSERRLAAILAADVVGYSRLMGADEAGTLAALRAALTEIVRPALDAHNGRLVKLMGDGALAEFPSVLDAVNSAVAIQKAMATREADRIRFRIGINLGDIIHEDDDIFGDGVNVAARLEGLADPGGVCVSRTVVTHVGDRAGVAFRPMGPQKVKNIAEPVEAFRVDWGAPPSSRTPPARGAWPPGRRRRTLLAAALAAVLVVAAAAAWRLVAPDAPGFDAARALALPTGPTVAVLPFENLSGDPGQDYLADGISEDLVIELGRYPDLNILSRRSTDAFRGQSMDARAIGAATGANYLLEGSVRQAGERLRVTARLVDAASGALVWSQAFNEALTAADLFDVQLRITEQVAAEVGDAGGAIKRIDRQRARTKAPSQLSSYECSAFQPGFFDNAAIQKRTAECIERVVADEPDYWRGWVQLANGLRTDVMLFRKNYEGSHAEKLDRALDAARRAVSLNPDAPRAHYVLANVLLLRGDREGYFAAAERALALGGDRWIGGEIGYYFVWAGRPDLGAALLRRAIALSPATAPLDWFQALATAHIMKGEYEAALTELQKGLQPEYWWVVALEVAVYAQLGRMDEAIAARERMYALRPGIKIGDIVWIYRRFQRPDALSANFVEGFRKAGIPEGRYRPLDLSDTGQP